MDGEHEETGVPTYIPPLRLRVLIHLHFSAVMDFIALGDKQLVLSVYLSTSEGFHVIPPGRPAASHQARRALACYGR